MKYNFCMIHRAKQYIRGFFLTLLISLLFPTCFYTSPKLLKQPIADTASDPRVSLAPASPAVNNVVMSKANQGTGFSAVSYMYFGINYIRVFKITRDNSNLDISYKTITLTASTNYLGIYSNNKNEAWCCFKPSSGEGVSIWQYSTEQIYQNSLAPISDPPLYTSYFASDMNSSGEIALFSQNSGNNNSFTIYLFDTVNKVWTRVISNVLDSLNNPMGYSAGFINAQSFYIFSNDGDAPNNLCYTVLHRDGTHENTVTGTGVTPIQSFVHFSQDGLPHLVYKYNTEIFRLLPIDSVTSTPLTFCDSTGPFSFVPAGSDTYFLLFQNQSMPDEYLIIQYDAHLIIEIYTQKLKLSNLAPATYSRFTYLEGGNGKPGLLHTRFDPWDYTMVFQFFEFY